MPEYYKYIEPGFRAVRPYKLYKTWFFNTSSFTPFSTSGSLNIYNAICPTTTGISSRYDQMVDVEGYPLGDTYGLRNGTWYTPVDEADVPHNYPNGYLARYVGGETRYVDDLYQGAISQSSICRCAQTGVVPFLMRLVSTDV